MDADILSAGTLKTFTGLLLGFLLSLGVTSTAIAAPGPLGKMVEKGKHIFLHDTFGGRGMTCDSCHTGAGMGPTIVPGSNMRGPSLSNAAAVFPRYKPDDGRVMTLADEIHGCIAGALGGKAPAYDSDAMRALETYLASLAQNKRLHMGGKYH